MVGGMVLGVAAPAQAVLGSQPGTLQLTPASGATSTTPTWSTTIGCPVGFQGSAGLEAAASDGTPFGVSSVLNGTGPGLGFPFSGTLEASMAGIQSAGGIADGNTTGQEFVVVCFSGLNATGSSVAYQDTFAYYSAGSYLTTSTSMLSTQTITFTSTQPSGATAGGPTYSVTATGGGSGNPVVFSVDATASSVCAISGSTVSFTAVGNCVIDANQAGNASYMPAAQAQQSFAVGQGSQHIAFTSTQPSLATIQGTYMPAAHGVPSGLPATFSIASASAGICSIKSGVVTFNALGTCTIDANQPGNANYTPAPQATQSILVKLRQSISFTSIIPADPDVNGTYSPKAKAVPSGLPTTLTIASGSATVCSIASGKVTFRKVGTCVVDAKQAGNSIYWPARTATQSIHVGTSP
jgi:hypothetical protein